MSDGALLALAVVVFGWAVLSEWLAARNVTGPLLLLVAGFLLANPDWGLTSVDLDSAAIHSLAELTLVLLLFADASKVPTRAAKEELPITARLLGIGLPLTILAGTAVALLFFPSMPVALAGLIGASLAPTDAALSAAVLADERIPLDLRRILNVESGLNDGIATPVVTTCLGAAATLLHIHAEHESGVGAIGAISIGAAVGIGIGGIGGYLLVQAHARGWEQHGARRIGTVLLAVGAFALANLLGGNPFVAAFLGGLAFGAAAKAEAEPSIELTELTGSLLSLLLWFVFGAGFVLPALKHLDAPTVLYAIASLTVVRMVPVALSLLGAGQDRATTAFIGWFGPRGLASVVFGLLALEELGIDDPQVVLALHTITLTILLSVVAHGVSARPLTTRYVRAERGASPPKTLEKPGFSAA